MTVLKFDVPQVPLEKREFQVVKKEETISNYYLSPVEREDLKCIRLGDELNLHGIVIKRIK